MCLLTVKGTPKVVLERSLEVYKVGTPKWDEQMFTPSQGFTYTLGAEVQAEIMQSEYHNAVGEEDYRIRDAVGEGNIDAYDQGLHSYTGKEAALRDWPNYAIYKAVIPVGAEVIFGFAGTVISNRLTVIKKVK